MKSPVPCRQNIISAMCGQEVINTLLTSCKTNIWKTQKENNFYIFHMPQLNQSKFLEIKLYCTWLFTIQYWLFTCSNRIYIYSEDLFDRIFFFKGVASVGIKSSLPVISEALHLPQTNHALPVLDKKICSVCDKSRPTLDKSNLTYIIKIKSYLSVLKHPHTMSLNQSPLHLSMNKSLYKRYKTDYWFCYFVLTVQS